jgi:hypothetical protein
MRCDHRNILCGATRTASVGFVLVDPVLGWVTAFVTPQLEARIYAPRSVRQKDNLVLPEMANFISFFIC